MVTRSVPEALRRGLTFWRRSIQARVVVSTVLLSAVVVTAVGWFLLRQVEQGLVNRRVDAILSAVAAESEQGNARLNAALGTDTNAGDQASDFFDPVHNDGLVRGFDIVLAGPPDEARQPIQQRGVR